MPVPLCHKILQTILIGIFFLFVIETPDFAQRNPDSSTTYPDADSLQIQQQIKSIAELEQRLKQTQNDLRRKQAELSHIEEKIKIKERLLKEKRGTNQSSKDKIWSFKNFLFVFFIIGIICLFFTFFRIKKF